MQQPLIPFFIDAYKLGHRSMYPEGTTLVYSNMAVRSFEHINNVLGFEVDEYVSFGVESAIVELKDDWAIFFNMNDSAFNHFLKSYKNTAKRYSGGADDYDVCHIIDLFDNSQLPIKFKCLPDGTVVKGKNIPFVTIENTDPKFFWLVNYIESDLSARIWKSIVSATIAYHLRKVCNKLYEQTGGADMSWFVDYQCHDFSFRGLSGHDDVCKVGAAHLTSFLGTDNLAADVYVIEMYNAVEPGGSVSATEHSVASCSILRYESKWLSKFDAERKYLNHLITNVYPTGILSYVSDTFDFWRLVTEILPLEKDTILNRDGKLVIRPDSGCPIKIICGDPDADTEHERKGLIETLADIFGYTTNEKGFKQLVPQIGAIYGDSITPQRLQTILQKLKAKGFASTNIVFGIGLT